MSEVIGDWGNLSLKRENEREVIPYKMTDPCRKQIAKNTFGDR